jgi:hypothetical protein
MVILLRSDMFAASFDEFTLLPEAQSLVGNVSLVLTDLRYNARREAGASNSEYDKMSSSAIKQTANFIEQILTPYGHEFIFCSTSRVPSGRRLWKAQEVEAF